MTLVPGWDGLVPPSLGSILKKVEIVIGLCVTPETSSPGVYPHQPASQVGFGALSPMVVSALLGPISTGSPRRPQSEGTEQ